MWKPAWIAALIIALPPSWLPQPGDGAVVHEPARGATFAAVDGFAYREMVQASRASDVEGIKELMRRGRIAVVDHGTPCLVLEAIPLSYRTEDIPAVLVRFRGGSLAGRKAWIAAHSLAPAAHP